MTVLSIKKKELKKIKKNDLKLRFQEEKLFTVPSVRDGNPKAKLLFHL